MWSIRLERKDLLFWDEIFCFENREITNLLTMTGAVVLCVDPPTKQKYSFHLPLLEGCLLKAWGPLPPQKLTKSEWSCLAWSYTPFWRVVHRKWLMTNEVHSLSNLSKVTKIPNGKMSSHTCLIQSPRYFPFTCISTLQIKVGIL